ncbi:MAG: PHD finger domain-containing protein [Planctomycetota bacterium]|jgi:DNA-directed RNA polymerase subunit RPC12/RpoP
MFELKTYHCPGCKAEIREKFTDGDEYICDDCGNIYHVLIDERSGNIGFVAADETLLQNPLGLPKGSIRALTTLLLAVTCWVMILMNRSVPGNLLGLLLTVTGYYFAFRKKDGTQSRIYNVSARLQSPLSLPSGSIRNILIAGFLVSAVILGMQGRLTEAVYVEFYLILTGLVAGHLLSKLLSHIHHPAALNFFNHCKGVIVLSTTFAFAFILVAGLYEAYWHLAISLSCIISFYFGSRS